MKSLMRLTVIGLCGLFMTALSPAHAASFGRTTVGTTPSAGLRADFKRGSKFVLSETGTLRQICAYLDGNGGGTGSPAIRFALYRDRNGLPGEQVAETTSEGWYFGPAQGADWYCLGAASAPLQPGTYWTIIHTGGDPGVVRYYYDGAANWYGNADTFADGASDTFGTGSAGEGTLSIRVDYLPDSESHFAGVRTVGTRVSAPMSAQMKRGSSFTLAEGAQLTTMNAYIDGSGGTSGSQPLWIALYNDVNGVPSALVAKGQVSSSTPLAGRTARWVGVVPVSDGPVFLMPGRYWIVLHTGGPAGVLRYYMEGTGNWRGNASPGEEPPSSFGAASSGDGTITANILYTPTSVRHHTFGRTTPGSIPSGPLTANYVRGSLYEPDHYFREGWVTALWAYMDGNGGASGSQKVRLALYTTEIWQPYMHILAASEEVTIAAGQPPGWVRFAIPLTRIHYNQYDLHIPHIMMFSGGTQGVARYYASDDADNWLGAPVAYSDVGRSLYLYYDDGHPEAQLLQQGTRTPSMYGEYLNTPETDSE